MTTKEKVQQQIVQNNDRLETLQRQAMKLLANIEQSAREATERGDRYIESTLAYYVRQLNEANAQTARVTETNRMLEYFLRGDGE